MPSVSEELASRIDPARERALFSTPYCIAAGFILGHAGLDAFTEQRVRDERLRALAGKVRHGGWASAKAEQFPAWANNAYDARAIDLSAFR